MKNTIIASVTTLVIGFFLGHVIFAKTPVTDHQAPMSTMTMQHTMPDGTVMGGNRPTMGSMMDDMMVGLNGKSGNVFDKEFIAEMVVHHQGAVAMAQAALKDGQHKEIKTLAQAIITAQNKEIIEMKAWYKAWYGLDLK